MKKKRGVCGISVGNGAALNDLLPLRLIKEPRKITRYQAILISIKEVGLIEPLMVFPQKDSPGKYILLMAIYAGTL